MPSRLVERSPLLALLAVAVGAYGCKDGAAAAPPLLDEAWCDISAIPCLVATQGSDGSPITCSVLGSDSVPASAPWGDRICFDSTSTTPSAACTALCNPGPHSYLNPAVYASGAGCTASVDTNPAYHPELNAQSYRAHACTGETNGESAGLSTTGTNSVLLSGAATASYGVATQSVALTGGRFDFTAPNVDCMGLESACSTQVNQIELDLADFSVGALSMTGLEVASDGLFETASGQLLAPQPPVAPDPTFLFDMPPGLVFDATAGIRLNGADAPGLVLNAEQESQGILVPSTGLIGFQFSLERTLDGQLFTLKGSATTSRVIDEPPTITAPAMLTVDAGAACSASVTFGGTASSPVGLAVRLDYVVDGALAAASPSASATVTSGSHAVTIVATDALGATSSASEMLTVTSLSAACP
ncbi:MAG TPA: hypothetical protein VK745_02435 [Polyangiaceae bacterium]|nr:hypothetical protein [Polyangiaceae bacterium]